MVRTDCDVPFKREDSQRMVRIRRNIDQDVLLLGEKDRHGGNPRSETPSDSSGQYARACESGCHGQRRNSRTIRHGESIITLPVGSSAEAVANLVKALNRHV